ncbi:MAG: hypothetical protein VX785_04875, partial [Actinomycetota bacterium]|nr:hypothetical protein [Actinomycetota bacterium]
QISVSWGTEGLWFKSKSRHYMETGRIALRHRDLVTRIGTLYTEISAACLFSPNEHFGTLGWGSDTLRKLRWGLLWNT